MKRTLISGALWLGLLGTTLAQVPDNLVVEGIPLIPPEFKVDIARYLEFRGAGFSSWHPLKLEMLVTTRFADTPQLHLVKMPGGARKQLTFLSEPARGGSFRPKHGDVIIFAQDTGGGEFYQLYRYDVADRKITLLTDGKSRNTGPRWSKSGQWLAYTSTRRNGRDNDVYMMDPTRPATDRLVIQVQGGGWSVEDWSPDESQLLLLEYISINEGYLHLLDVPTGRTTLLTLKTDEKFAIGSGRFAPDGKSVYFTTEVADTGAAKRSEFHVLVKVDLATRQDKFFTGHIPWDVDEFEVSRDGRGIAFITNEDGVGVLHLMNARTGKEVPVPKLPLGIPSNLEWHENNRDLAFNLHSAKSPSDVYSLDVKSGKVERWTESETGGLDPAQFVEPTLAKLNSFDGLGISAFVYRPEPTKFPGKRPVIINIHGGPEGQSRPMFQGRNNYFLNEMGVAIVYPNVRGSSGYGTTFLKLDDDLKREDSVRDIGAIIQWIKAQPDLDGGRIAVLGGSYGGFMVLASMVQFNDQLKCGVDVVGISNFLTFLKNTQDYRRDLRRVEYGDERDERMRAFLERISPANHADKINRPLFVVQGKNDPRVPLSESEQMVKAIRDHGGTVWYLMAKDEGHGFAKKKNADFQFLATILFFREHLLK
ncbi:MAG: peptidase S9, prolyl oligopeptidase [Verrucomicrobia bacterium]|nr:MAG: peptidase S9, prolyl oligopeptidase [Verrucomicrobiota bacterium]